MQATEVTPNTTQTATQPPTQTPPQTNQPTEPPKVEAKVEEKDEKPKVELNSKLFQEIAKKEKRLVEQQRKERAKLESERQEFERNRKALEEKARNWDEVNGLVNTKPADAVSRLGTDPRKFYEGLTNHYLNDGKATPESVRQETLSEVERIKLELENTRKEIKEREEARLNEEKARLLQSWNDSIVNTVKGNLEKYELINLFEQAPTVAQIIQLHYQKTEAEGEPRLLTIDEAAELLESDLEKQWEKVLQSKKFSSRVTPPPAPKDEKKPLSSNQPKTITNDMVSTAPSMLPAHTEADRIRRALEKLNGTASA